MKHTIKTISFAAIVALVGIAGCQKGDPGPAGADGTNGTNGTNGSNGAGFDEAIKFGGIFLKLEGKRPDGITFSDTVTFRFAPADKSYSSITGTDGCEPTSTVKRYLVMDNDNQDDFVNSVFEQYSCDGDYNYYDLYVKKSVFFPTEHVYFNLNDRFSFSQDIVNGDPDLPLNPVAPGPNASGQLVYSFDFISNENSTGYNLHVTGSVSASVFTQINGGRVGRRSTATPLPIERAVMKPM